jgi:hypothetical protein
MMMTRPCRCPHEPLRGAVQRAGHDDQHGGRQHRGGHPHDDVAQLRIAARDDRVGPEMQHPHRQVGDPEDHPVVAERARHGQRRDEHRAHGRQQHDAHGALVGPRGVAQPHVGLPRPPQRGEDGEPLDEARPRRVGRDEPRDLRDREDEDEVEEELERRDLLLDVDGLVLHAVGDGAHAVQPTQAGD